MIRFSLSLLLFIFSFFPLIAEESPVSASLLVNNSPTELFSPLLKINGIIYAPLRDILLPLKGGLSYQKKWDSYLLSLKKANLSCSFQIGNNQVILEQTRHFLPVPIISRYNRVYVPLYAFMKLFQVSISYSKNNYNLSIPQSLSHLNYYPLKKTGKVLASTGATPHLYRYPFELPFFNLKKRTIFLSIGNSEIHTPLKHKLFFKQSVLLANLSSVLPRYGFSYKKEGSQITIKKFDISAVFSTESSLVVVQKKGKSTTFFAPLSVQVRKGAYYLPLLAFASAFDLPPYFNNKTNTIHLLNVLNEVFMVRTNKQDRIEFTSSIPIKMDLPLETRLRKGYDIFIQNTVLNTQSLSFNLDHLFVKKVSLKQISPTVVRLRLLSNKKHAFPSMSTDTGSQYLLFDSILETIHETTKKEAVIVKIKGTGTLDSTYWFATKPNRLILDIPNSVSNLPQIKRSYNTFYSQIRSSQFKESPLQTRIVFDLKGQKPHIETSQKGPFIYITFKPASSFLKKAVKEIASSPKKATISASISNFNHVLSKKVIVIDPGHGGTDPGAIGPRHEYEKFYTLDVSKRLQKLLAQKGAFVVLTRKQDINPGLSKRTVIANKNEADAFISIHFNSFIKSSVRGTETYYYKYKDKRLARHIQKQLIKDLNLKNLGIKRARLYVLRNTHMPAALVEPAFLTNKYNLIKIKSPAFRQKIAQSLYQGILNYFVEQERMRTKKRK